MLIRRAASWLHSWKKRVSSTSFPPQADHNHTIADDDAADERCRKNGRKHHHNRLKRAKRGYFPVLAFDDLGVPGRFVVPLAFLTNPAFLKLLDKARDEFGFQQHGLLKLPCHRDEHEKLLLELRHE